MDDDIKLYAKSEWHNGISFGVEKCGQMDSKGKVVKTDEV